METAANKGRGLITNSNFLSRIDNRACLTFTFRVLSIDFFSLSRNNSIRLRHKKGASIIVNCIEECKCIKKPSCTNKVLHSKSIYDCEVFASGVFCKMRRTFSSAIKASVKARHFLLICPRSRPEGMEGLPPLCSVTAGRTKTANMCSFNFRGRREK